MTEPDPQHEAFAEAGESDWARSAALLEGATVHEAGDMEGVLAPEKWHEQGWDSERQQPKTHDEAAVELAGRIADPSAPDTEDQAGAYDHPGGA